MNQMLPGAGFRVRRRWALAGMAGIAATVAVILMPWGAGPAALELVVLNPDGRFETAVRIPRVWTDTSGVVSGAVVRVPLILAVRNTGGEAGRATRIELSVPARFRLVRGDGRPMTGRLSPGSPLVRYAIDLPIPGVRPGAPPVRLPALDTLWLEPIIPAFYCVSLSDSVPEFVPSPPAPVEAIATVRIFYSFGGGNLERRQTGLLTVQMDPALLKREVPEPPPLFPAEYREPEAAGPALAALRYVGSRQAFCGEPEDPLELLVTLWETPRGGRFLVLDHGGAPRKYLFDLDRDSIIELEMWDPDADGDFEARRQARMPIPAFLLPAPPAPAYDLSVFAALPADSLARLDRYRDARARGYDPVGEPPDTMPRVHRFQPLVLRGRDEDADSLPPGYTRRYWNPPGRTAGAAAPAPPSRSRLAPPPVAAPGDAAAPGPQHGAPPVAAEPAPPAVPLAGRPADPARDEPAPSPAQPTPAPVVAPSAPAPQPPAPSPEQVTPARPPPKLVGRPVDSIRPLPDTTGPRR